MSSPLLKLSVLDQSPVNDDETGSIAFQHTIQLAQKAEEWGYNRFWVTEHHGSSRVVGSSPEVLISHLLAKTSSIRVGSGGVMLQHYSPYKVAENFNVLASLAPGRVDLGIGGGPGGLPYSTRALQQDLGDRGKSLAEKLEELEQFLHNELDPASPLYGLRANPLPPQPAELFLLGTTPDSAKLAAKRRLPYVFALFLNNDEAVMAEAVETYRRLYPTGAGSSPGKETSPQPMLALPVIVADTEQEAAGYAAEVKVVRIHLESGRSFTLRSEEAAREFGRQAQAQYTIEVRPGNVIYGSRETIYQKLCDVRQRYLVDELFIVTAIRNFAKRLRSYELLSEALLKSGHQGAESE